MVVVIAHGDRGLPQVAYIVYNGQSITRRTLDTLHDEWLSLRDL